MTVMRVITPVADLRSAPDGGLDSQLVFGEPFDVDQVENGFSHGTTACGYRGWIPSDSLGPDHAPTHRVGALATYVYAKPNLKAATLMRLPFAAQITITAQGEWAKTPLGFIYARHLTAAPTPDFVALAEQFIGVPYLWGGRSSLGLDCSALVQLCLTSAGVSAPRDSGPQQAALGKTLPQGAPLQRGDLLFWKGHVGIMCNPETLLHANAHHMAVAAEPLAEAVARIKENGDGDIVAIKRILALA